VEVPYENTSLPALLVHPDPADGGTRPAPCMVFFDGFDVTKELQYGYGIPDLVARGRSAASLSMGPGTAKACALPQPAAHARPNAMPTPVYEYVASRGEFDARRIGVMALSLAATMPRAQPRSSRAMPVVSPGARSGIITPCGAKRLDELATGKVLSLSVPPEHLQWVLGVSSQAAALKKLEGFRLDGIVQKMRCPFLLLHGEGDEQIPLAIAQKCFDAVGSTEKTFRVFTREEGGFHHCQVDNVTIGVHAMWDWIAGC